MQSWHGEGEVTEQHVAELHRAASKRCSSDGSARTWAITIAASLAMFALLIAAGEATSPWLTLGFCLGIAFTFLWSLSFFRLFGRPRYRQEGGVLATCAFAVDGQGLRMTSPHRTWILDWPLFIDLSEEPSTLILWTDPTAGVMIPKRAFRDDVELAEFQSFARAAIGRGGAADVADHVHGG